MTVKKLCDFNDAYVDPYIKVALMPWQVFGNTSTIEDHHDGDEMRWDEEIILEHPLDPSREHDCNLVVQAWDNDVGVDDLIGQGFVEPEDLKQILERPNVTRKVKCELTNHEDESAGAVFLEITYCLHPQNHLDATACGQKQGTKWHKGGPTRGAFKVTVSRAIDLWNPSKQILNVESDRHVLMLAKLVAVGYFGMGAVVFQTNCLSDGVPWTFIDTVYFGIVTITTTGYGDLLPNSHHCNNGTMVFTCFYAFVGVGLIASIMGFLVGAVLEMRQKAKFVDAMKVNPNAAPQKNAPKDGGQTSWGRRRSMAVDLTSSNPILHWIPLKFRAMVRAFLYMFLLKLVVVVYFCYSDSRRIDPDSDLDSWGTPNASMFNRFNHSSPPPTLLAGATAQQISKHAAYVAYSGKDGDDDGGWHYCASSPVGRQGCSNYCAEENYAICADGSCDQCVENFKHLFLTPLDAVYMVSISMTSVGYGDISPSSQPARCFAIFWILLGTLFVGKAFGLAADHYLTHYQEKLNEKNIAKDYDHKSIMRLDEDSSGEVDEVEFVTHMLVQSNVVDLLKLTDIRQRFKELDKSGDGFIDEQDLGQEET
jgi:hypothetical protein